MATYKARLHGRGAHALTEELVSLRKALSDVPSRPRASYDHRWDLPQNGLDITSPDNDVGLRIEWTRKPAAAITTCGLAGRFVKVTAAKPFSFARVRFAISRDAMAHLQVGTLIAARWNPASKRFHLIPASGYNEGGQHAYAQISRAGVFTLVGLPRDPQLVSILRQADARSLENAGGEAEGSPSTAALTDDATAANTGLPFQSLSRMESPRIAISNGPELDILRTVHARLKGQRSPGDLRLPGTWPTPRSAWKMVGPDGVAGRMKSVVTDPNNGETVYAGAAGGGVWKTTNGGRAWFATMQRELSLAIGALAIAPSQPRVLYAATGEWTGNSERAETPSGQGAGVYRTNDSAQHWHLCGAIESFLCTSIAIHPRDPDRVFVAGNKGLHRSTDGGLTWRVVPLGDQLSAREAVTSVVIFHDLPSRMFAAVHRRGVFRSEDGGDTWVLLGPAEGVPSSEIMNAPKLSVGCSGDPSTRVVAAKIGDNVYRSINGGADFDLIGMLPDRSSSMIPWCSVIAVHPTRSEVIFAGGTSLHRTLDGGGKWEKVAGYGTAVHEDQQAIAFDPVEPSRLYLANDGGVWRSTDGGTCWQTAHSALRAAQLYTLDVSDARPLRYAATLQDASGQIWDERERVDLNNGEGGVATFLPRSSDELLAGSKWSSLTRFRRGADGRWNAVEVGPDIATGLKQALAISPRHPTFILAISHDGTSLLERPAKSSINWPARLSLSDAAFRSVVIGNGNGRHAYAGDDKGRLWCSDAAAITWRVIWEAPGQLPVVSITSCSFDDTRIYVCASDGSHSAAYRLDIRAKAVLAVDLDREGKFPNSFHVRQILCGDFEGSLVALGKYDVRYSVDTGWSWRSARNGLPRVRIMGGVLNDRFHLVLATHGRGALRCLL